MMKVTVIGGTGHIGSQLIPRLVQEGMKVRVITRGKSSVPDRDVWEKVEFTLATYRYREKNWYQLLESVDTDVLIDLLGIDLPGTYNQLKLRLDHLIVCGSFWMYGPPNIVPTPEESQNSCEFKEYARRFHNIVGIQNQAAHDGIPFTAIMPSNICGPGKVPLECRGGRDPEVHRNHKAGKRVVIPQGCETLIAPCDVEDVAEGFFKAVQHRDKAAGELFNVGPPYAVTIPKFIETYETIYRTEIPVEDIPWEEFLKEELPDPQSNYHFRAHMSPDISKIRNYLGFEPRFTPEAAMERAVAWMRNEELV